MTTLIVGCGYLGRRVARLLSGRGEVVLGTTRSASRGDELADWGARAVVADVLDPGSLRDLPSADRVLYCVGLDRAAGVPMRTVYVDGLRNVLQALDGKAGRFVYASATSVYGRNDGGWVDEDSPTEPATASGRACLEAETLAREWAGTRRFELSIVRYSGLYGPGRVIRQDALKRGEPIAGDPEKYLNLIHIDDAASAALAALDRGQHERVYLASDDRPVPRREYYELAARLLGAPDPRFAPPGPGSAAAPREEADRRVSNRRIKEELGLAWAYPDITTGLPATFAIV